MASFIVLEPSVLFRSKSWSYPGGEWGMYLDPLFHLDEKDLWLNEEERVS